MAALACAGPLAAQDNAAEELCKDNSAVFEERLAACDALIASGDYDDQAWVFERRGDAFKDIGEYAKAIGAYRQSLAIDGDYLPTHQGLVVSSYQLDQIDAAFASSSLLIAANPDSFFNNYWHASVLEELDQPDAAIAAYGNTAELRPGSYFAWRDLGYLLIDERQNDAAIEPLERARDIRPFSTGPYGELAMGHGREERLAESALNSRIAIALNPNLDAFTLYVVELTPDVENPGLPPLVYAPPAAGLEMQFLQTILPRDTRDEMEAAIGDLAAWFKAPPKAPPKAAAFVTRWLNPDGDDVGIELRLDAQDAMEDYLPPGGQMPQGVLAYRGLLLTEIRPMGDRGPQIAVIYDGPQPAEIWPLAVGNAVSGTGRYLLICTDRPKLVALMMGCRVGMESVELGTLEYSFAVDRVEQVRVPLGDFVTYVVRYRELAVVQFGENQQERQIETHWWVAPELNYWVQRTTLEGEDISKLVAVSAK